jgi:ubiquitin C-terminal hydrolase
MQDVEKQKPSIYAHVEFIASINEAGAEKSVQRWSIDDGLLKAIHGLYNLGNTCFFNSVLQSLSHAKPLVTYFIDFDRVFPPEKKKTEPLAPTKKLFAGELTFSMQLHFNQYYSWQQNILNPKMLFHTVCKMAPQFKGYAQHDAQELLRYLQMNARDEFVRALKEKALTEGEKVNEYANIIDETFRSEICSTIICHNCKNVSRRYEDCYDISIPIPRILKQSKKGAEKCPTLQQRFGDLHARELATYRVNKEDLLNPNAIMEQVRFAKREEENDDEVTLLHCMWGFSACELLTEENGYQCDKCSHIEEELTGEKTDKKIVLRDATKQISMNMPAKNLTIHLKRFVHNNKLAKQDNSHKANLLNFLLETNGGIFQKDDTKVTFQTTLELGSFIHPSSHCHAIPQEKKNRYQLYAVIEHEGSMNAGHYTAYVRLLQVDKEGRSTRGDWYHISDSYVTKVTLNELLGCEPYILFYELME